MASAVVSQTVYRLGQWGAIRWYGPLAESSRQSLAFITQPKSPTERGGEPRWLLFGEFIKSAVPLYYDFLVQTNVYFYNKHLLVETITINKKKFVVVEQKAFEKLQAQAAAKNTPIKW